MHSKNNSKIQYLIVFLTLVMIGSIAFTLNSNLLMAQGASGDPLDDYTKYREQYGISTARLDMQDNARIDNSVPFIEYESIKPPEEPEEKKITYPDINLLTDRDVPNNNSDFIYHWEQGKSLAGYEYSSYINEPVQVTFLDEQLEIPDNSASLKLQNDYGILLSNEELDWQHDFSYAMLEMMKTIPQKSLIPSKWILTRDHIDNDIIITKTDSHRKVVISIYAFDNSNPKVVLIDDKKGKFFSQRLHHALVWFVTDEGKDKDAVELILNKRYGVSTRVPDYEKLTKYTTGDTKENFQEFHSWELVEIINIFEEMPTGFHKIEGFDYLVRRVDGVSHPTHLQAPAVSWPSERYVEFMEAAFRNDDNYLHKLILHEKSHFLWYHVFSKQLKDDWIKLGGWYKSASSESGWLTTKTTEFVTAYAHLKNPDEDMAESIAYFITNPDKLKSRSLPKYEFILESIMQGSYYISVIREDLTFEVYNLYPDYIYPGKIIRVDVSISGAPKEDKHATIEIELNAKNNFEGAKSASFRLFSENGTYVDVGLRPIDGKLGSVLRGEVNISKYAKNGFWYPNQIKVNDQVGNKRFEGQDDFGWKFFINNPLEDVVAPEYVKNTLKLKKRSDDTSYQRPIQILTVSWQVNENTGMKNCYARIINEDKESYSYASWEKFDSENKLCTIEYILTEYHRSGNYNVRSLKMVDIAGNGGLVDFTKLAEDHTILIRTVNPDTKAPYLDVNNISISAVPTFPQDPNGETRVTIVYHAKDDKSGLGSVSYNLRDPQGKSHGSYHAHENFRGVFFKGIPDELTRYEINAILPVGSPPGKWGLTHMNLSDKVNNKETYEFTEIIHFELE